MANVKILNKVATRDGDTVVITQTVEERYSPEELSNLLQQISHQRRGVIRQIKKLKEQVAEIAQREEEIQQMVAEFESDVLSDIEEGE
jgi:succinate dehydrogenase/fumarate reductase flavoprotein subunit